ncbi:hypothetical protein QCD85_18725 [Paenibacillus sp. PsM32]|uniref:Uncharacterized protein n=1 Tax=Paenibacillus kyungheensis TaxID=1452732 RepID=A0AAX3M1P5_9BACL|nr:MULTISPECIES: hypothetical protein [Paenibacillus]MDN4620155.1 hypothetical protein [Paenibacillus sp. PsM32]MDQ1236109.1 hypothetical protein [Paenibacillus sp. SORGH_AS_0306]MDR6108464.1 hypothetical protein [Paenibacillus sp. SORGH_AS_0338]WCT55574.1 hypothetical protein PQ456_20900 [Paenibacillus kyungheensis]
MIYEDLIKRVGWGEEFSFYYQDNRYWISSNNDGYYLTREKDSFSQSFHTSKELFDLGEIEGKSFKEVWNVIDIL